MKYGCDLVYVIYSESFVDYCPRQGTVVFKPQDETLYTVSKDDEPGTQIEI